MKPKEALRKITPYVITIVIAVVGIFIANWITQYEIMAKGIISLAVLYFSYRYYLAPKRIERSYDNMPVEYKFPTSVVDLISGLFLSVVLYLAASQIVNVILWMINFIKSN